MVEEGGDRVCKMEGEVGSLITPLVLLSAFPNLVADDSYARFLGFQGYLYPNVLA